MAEKKNSKWISTSEAAEMLGCSNVNVQVLCRKGYFRLSKGNSKFYRILREDVENRKEEIMSVTDIMVSTNELKAEMLKARNEVQQSCDHYKDEVASWTLRGRLIEHYGRIYDIFCMYIDSNKDKLDERSYEVLMLSVDGMGVHDIAKKYGCTPQNIDRLYNRALWRLRAINRTQDNLVALLKEKEQTIDELIAENKELKEMRKALVEDTNAIEDIDEYLDTRIMDLSISVRLINILHGSCVDTIGQLIETNKSNLLKERGMGRKSMLELEEFMDREGIHFGMTRLELIKQRKLA